MTGMSSRKGQRWILSLGAGALVVLGAAGYVLIRRELVVDAAYRARNEPAVLETASRWTISHGSHPRSIDLLEWCGPREVWLKISDPEDESWHELIQARKRWFHPWEVVEPEPPASGLVLIPKENWSCLPSPAGR